MPQLDIRLIIDEQKDVDLYIELLKNVLSASIYEESAWWVVNMPDRNWKNGRNPLTRIRNHFKSQLIQWLDKHSYLLIRKMPYDAQARNLGRDWPYLLGFTMVGRRRLDNVQACIEDVINKNIPGDFIETGVWRGGATILMRALLKAHNIVDRKVWVADSFEGLPRPAFDGDGTDLSGVEVLKVSIEEVKANFAKFGLLDDQVEFLKGWFCDTLPNAPIQKLAILRLDGDMYQSTMDSLQFLYPKLSRGGYVIVDDYYSWQSCRQAVTDYLGKHSLFPDIKPIDGDGAYWKCE